VNKILGIRTHVFAAKEDMFSLYLAMLARSSYLFDKVLDPFRGILNGKWFSEDVPVPITEHGNMVLFSVIDGDTHDVCTVSSFFKQPKQLLTLVYINVFLFHGEAPPFSCSCLMADCS